MPTRLQSATPRRPPPLQHLRLLRGHAAAGNSPVDPRHLSPSVHTNALRQSRAALFIKSFELALQTSTRFAFILPIYFLSTVDSLISGLSSQARPPVSVLLFPTPDQYTGRALLARLLRASDVRPALDANNAICALSLLANYPCYRFLCPCLYSTLCS